MIEIACKNCGKMCIRHNNRQSAVCDVCRQKRNTAWKAKATIYTCQDCGGLVTYATRNPPKSGPRCKPCMSRFLSLVASEGRKAQLAANETPKPQKPEPEPYYTQPGGYAPGGPGEFWSSNR